MFSQCHVPVLLTLLSLLALVQCVTVYGPTGAIGLSTSTTSVTSTADGAAYTGDAAAAYNQVVLQAPPVPQPPPPTQFSIQLQNSAANVPGLSIPQRGDFYGFSIEMSVADQISTSIAAYTAKSGAESVYSWNQLVRPSCPGFCWCSQFSMLRSERSSKLSFST